MEPTATIRLPGPLTAVRTIGSRSVGDARPAAGTEPSARQAAASEAQRVEVQSLLTALESAVQEFTALRQKMLKEAEGQLVDLAIHIARKVLMQEIQAQSYQIEPMVREALASVPARQDALVRLNPDDYERCQGMSGDVVLSETVRFVADPSVGRAQCVVETATGRVESSIEAHLGEVASALKGLE